MKRIGWPGSEINTLKKGTKRCLFLFCFVCAKEREWEICRRRAMIVCLILLPWYQHLCSSRGSGSGQYCFPSLPGRMGICMWLNLGQWNQKICLLRGFWERLFFLRKRDTKGWRVKLPCCFWVVLCEDMMSGTAATTLRPWGGEVKGQKRKCWGW